MPSGRRSKIPVLWLEKPTHMHTQPSKSQNWSEPAKNPKSGAMQRQVARRTIYGIQVSEHNLKRRCPYARTAALPSTPNAPTLHSGLLYSHHVEQPCWLERSQASFRVLMHKVERMRTAALSFEEAASRLFCIQSLLHSTSVVAAALNFSAFHALLANAIDAEIFRSATFRPKFRIRTAAPRSGYITLENCIRSG